MTGATQKARAPSHSLSARIETLSGGDHHDHEEHQAQIRWLELAEADEDHDSDQLNQHRDRAERVEGASHVQADMARSRQAVRVKLSEQRDADPPSNATDTIHSSSANAFTRRRPSRAIQDAAVVFTRSANRLRNFATFGPMTARQ